MCVPISVSTQKLEGEDYYNKGISLYNVGKDRFDPEGVSKLKMALKAFNKAIKDNPYVPEFYYMRGITLLQFIHFYFRPFTNEQENMFLKSLTDFKKSLTLNNQFYIAYSGMGNAHDRYGLFDDAIEYYNKSLLHEDEIKEKNGKEALASIYFSRGRAYHRTLKSRCIQDYEKSLKYYELWQTKMHLATAYLQAGMLKKAIKMSDKAVNAVMSKEYQAPWDYRALQTRGKCHILLHDYDKAIDDLHRALDIAPFQDPDLLLLLGEAYRKKGNSEKATNNFKKCIEKSAELLKHPHQMKPKYTVHNTRGLAYMNLGLYDNAVDDFKSAAKLAPEYYPHAHTHYKTESLKNLALTYMLLGNKQKARKVFDKAKTIAEYQELEFTLRELNELFSNFS